MVTGMTYGNAAPMAGGKAPKMAPKPMPKAPGGKGMSGCGSDPMHQCKSKEQRITPGKGK
jgi:hypothetical protein